METLKRDRIRSIMLLSILRLSFNDWVVGRYSSTVHIPIIILDHPFTRIPSPDFALMEEALQEMDTVYRNILQLFFCFAN
jgi:endonuclease V-like protein UPF0215 family